MTARSAAASVVRHLGGAAAEAILIAAMVAVIALALSGVYGPARFITGSGGVEAARMGTIEVTMGTATTATADSASGSIFTAWGCGFRVDDAAYYMVVRGPAPDTKSLAYWVDPFPTGSDGCGSSTVSWTSSGVAGDFDVYVVRSASGNPWQARPASNVVTVTITDP